MARMERTNEIHGIPLETAVHACFLEDEQPGLEVIAARPYGASSKGRTARVSVRLPDGKLKDFFFRCILSSSDVQIQAEFSSLQRLYDANPDVVPKPHRWGKILDENNMAKSQESRVKSQESRVKSQESRVKSQESRVKSQESREKERKEEREKESSNAQLDISVNRAPQQNKATYFMLCDFVHSSPYLPSPVDLCTQLACIHQFPRTMSRFGSDIPRYESGICIEPALYNRWADCFTSLVKAFLKQDIAVNGKWPAYEAAFEIFISRTISRLLDPLQENGHLIVPTLIHGNLSAKHLGIRISDGMPVLFSPCAIYAHHEYELGVSRLAIGGLDRTYENQYLRFFLPSQPIDEVYDRITLYGILFNLKHSIPYNGLFRDRVYSDVISLNTTYGSK